MFRMSCLGDRSVVASCLRRNFFVCLFVFFFFYETANRKSNQEQLCRLLFLYKSSIYISKYDLCHRVSRCIIRRDVLVERRLVM